MVDYINGVAKFVDSTTLQEPLGWNDSTLIGENVAERVADLKRQPGKDIMMVGSDTRAHYLLRHGLLDELKLMVLPVVVGAGKRLFEEGGSRMGLELIESKTFGTGVVSLTYGPAGQVGEG